MNQKTNPKTEGLVKDIGLLALVASVINCMIGGGIFRLPGSVYTIVGTASPLVYLMCFIIMSLVALVFIQVGSKINVSGGPYAYVEPVLGSYPGFICGILLWALAVFAMASVGNAYASFLGQMIPIFSSPLAQKLTLGFTLILLALFNIKGVKKGAKLSILLGTLKIIPLLLIGIIGIPHLDASRLAIPTPLPWSTLSRGAMVLIFAFTGIECALIPSGEIKNPEKTLSRALFISLFAVLIIYLGVQVVSQSVLGSELGNPNGFPLALTAERILGPWGRALITVGAVLSTLGYLSAMTLSLPRSLFAFAEKGYLPKKLALIHPVHRTPWVAIIIQVCITWLLAISNQFEVLAVLSNLAAILMYMLCAFASIKLGMNQKRGLSHFIIPAFATLAMSYLLTSVSLTEWLSVFGVILASSLLFALKSNLSRQ